MSVRDTPLIAGNWKMNTTLSESLALARAVAAEPVPGVDVVLFPPFPWLAPVRGELAGSTVALGAQDCCQKSNGAVTGAVSVSMIREVCTHVIIGHSERRAIFGESDDLIRDKITAALDGGLLPIVCVGESLETRDRGDAEGFVARQIEAAFRERTREEISACAIAYEPIWAIGTGVAASAGDAESMSNSIRNHLNLLLDGVGAETRILYGGSVTPANSAETLHQPNVDGALVGGASLNAESFLAIARSAHH